jgi:hypothetical protein
MEEGCLIAPLPTMETVRAHAAASLASLPESLRQLDDGSRYEVRRSAQLSALLNALRAKYVPEVLPAAPRG